MSVLRPSTHSATTSPPRPPSPPSGPPNSMNFSRRKLHAPAPPSPLFTKILAWSRNFMVYPVGRKRRRGNAAIPPSSIRCSADRAGRNGLFGGLRRQRRDRDEGAAVGAGAVGDRALDLGEEGVVAAHVDMLAGVVLGAALADDDVAGDDDLAAELL